MRDGDDLTTLRARVEELERERDAAITAAIASEREACRKIAEDKEDDYVGHNNPLDNGYGGMAWASACREIERLIAARGSEGEGEQ